PNGWPQQIMPSLMELDLGDALPEAVVGMEPGAVLVRLETPGQDFYARRPPRQCAQIRLGPGRPFPAQGVPQRHVARQRIVVLQRRRLVQDLVRGHAPTLSHVEWPGSAEVLEEPQLSLAQAAHAQSQLRPAQQVCQRRQRPILDLAAAEVQDDAGAILLQDALQELAGAAELQFPVDAE